MHNVSHWPNPRHLGEPLGAEGLLEAVSFKKTTEGYRTLQSQDNLDPHETLRHRCRSVLRHLDRELVGTLRQVWYIEEELRMPDGIEFQTVGAATTTLQRQCKWRELR